MRWAEIRVQAPVEAQEAVSNILIENGCAGSAVQDETVKGYLPVDDRLEERLLAMRERVGELGSLGLEVGEFTIGYVEEEDWAESWKQYFTTTRVGKKIIIKPTWEEYTPASKREIVIELDPGMAFGTGSHATTRLCLAAMEKYLKPRSVVVDFGTGSGVLAIAAVKMRARLVIAFDFDPIAVRVARENVVRNDVMEAVEVHQAESPRFIGEGVDMVCANIIAEVIIANVSEIARLLRLGGLLIASGITTGKAFDVEQALRNEGFDILSTLSEGEWVEITAVKGSQSE
ncbi:MAG: 50S ribosomal protein L11 methyltransferase [Armatimonadota bacterium]